MPEQHVAFLRAVNVGRRIVRKEQLISVFESSGFTGAYTFLASGNVIFEAEDCDMAAVIVALEKRFMDEVGFETSIFIRTAAHVATVLESYPFLPITPEHLTNCIGFLPRPLDDVATERLMGLTGGQDRMATKGREIYWASELPQSSPTFTIRQLEKAIGMPTTFRAVNSLCRLMDAVNSR